MTPDQINAAFELLASIFILNHCRVLYRDKCAKGVSILSSVFFSAWGFWNIYFYPALDQHFSMYAGLCVVVSNSFYIAMMTYYNHISRQDKTEVQA